MKRFWIFVIICIVSLGIGFTVFRFMTLDETIYVSQASYEVNSGETFKLDIKKKNLKSGTKISATVANSSVLKQTDESEFQFTAQNGGTTIITLNSNSKGFSPIQITVSVGNGSILTPYYIKDKNMLAKVGKSGENGAISFPLDKYYKLTSDIDMTGVNWTPIANGVDAGFTGQFDFDGHRISNLNLQNNFENAGLFAKIGDGAYVKNLLISNFNFNASFDNVGAVAGINLGSIQNVDASSLSIISTKESANVGGIVGLNNNRVYKAQVSGASVVKSSATNSNVGGIAGQSSAIGSLMANISVSSAKCDVSADKNAGGIVGLNKGSYVENCFTGDAQTSYTISSTNNLASVGGIVGNNSAIENGSSSIITASVADCYTVVGFGTVGKIGAIIGTNTNSSDEAKYNKIFGNYYASDRVNKDITGVNGVPVQTEKGGKVGVYGKTLTELESSSDIYFSYFTSDTKQEIYWQFADKIWIFKIGNLPTLNFDCPDIGSRIENFVDKGSITDATNFVEKLKNATANDHYTIANDITLTSYTPFEFSGSLDCIYTKDGPTYTISLVVDNPSYQDIALFTKLGTSAKLSHIKLNIVVKNVSQAKYVAGLVAHNEGIVDSCVVEGNIEVQASTNDLYIGGIVAENKKTVRASTSKVTITYNKDANYYIGGVCAINNGDLISSNNIGTLQIGSSSHGAVGGICGTTFGKVASCKNSAEIIGNIDASSDGSYYGGVVGVVENGSSCIVTTSKNEGTIRGSNVGGIAGKTSGVITESVSSATLKGRRIGGLVFSLTKGYISNCLSDNRLMGVAGDSKSAGFICNFDGLTPNDDCAKLQSSFSSCTFDGSGTNHYESTTKGVRGNVSDIGASDFFYIFSAVNDHTMDYCAYVVRPNKDIKRERYDDSNGRWIAGWPNHGSRDRQITEEVAKKGLITDDFKFGDVSPYANADIWLFQEGEYPVPTNCVK